MKFVQHFSMLALTLVCLASGVRFAYADDAMMKQDNSSMAMQKDDAMMKKDDGMKKDTMMKNDDHMAKKDAMSKDGMSKDTMNPASDTMNK